MSGKYVTPSEAALGAQSQQTIYTPPGAPETNNAAGGSDAQVSNISSYIKNLTTGASGSTGLLQDPAQANALAQSIQGYTSPYISSLQAMFGNAGNVAKSLSSTFGPQTGPGAGAVNKALSASNQSLASNLSAYAPAIQNQVSTFVPGNIDNAMLGALTSAFKYYIGSGDLSSTTLASIPALQQNPDALAIANTLTNLLGSDGQLGTALPVTTTPGTTPAPATTTPGASVFQSVTGAGQPFGFRLP